MFLKKLGIRCQRHKHLRRPLTVPYISYLLLISLLYHIFPQRYLIKHPHLMKAIIKILFILPQELMLLGIPIAPRIIEPHIISSIYQAISYGFLII